MQSSEIFLFDTGIAGFNGITVEQSTHYTGEGSDGRELFGWLRSVAAPAHHAF